MSVADKDQNIPFSIMTAIENSIKELVEKHPRSTFCVKTSRAISNANSCCIDNRVSELAADPSFRDQKQLVLDIIEQHNTLRQRFPEYNFKFIWKRKP